MNCTFENNTANNNGVRACTYVKSLDTTTLTNSTGFAAIDPCTKSTVAGHPMVVEPLMNAYSCEDNNGDGIPDK